MTPSPDIADRLAAIIAAEGPIPLERFMAEANAYYYATHAAIGAEGDFITAPEISQMFGEMVGLCLADLWQRAGSPAPCAYVELGPGRGSLAVDALRAMAVAGLEPEIHLVETSELLRSMQRARLGLAQWHDTIDTLPTDRPLLIVANEFFDALAVRQLVRAVAGWREVMVGHGPDGFATLPGGAAMDHLVPPALWTADPGAVIEQHPSARTIMTALAARLAVQGGALLAIDYGYAERAAGDTLQAVHAHAYADPFARPGTSDLTAHVDFAALGDAAASGGACVAGPVEQGQWLVALGLPTRTAALGRAAPDRAGEIASAYRRLTHDEEMGTLFKVLAVIAPHWPDPAGFG